MAPEPVMLTPKKRTPVPSDILADPRLVEVSGTARTLFAALYPSASADPLQTIKRAPAPASIGWLLAPTGQPASVARLAKITGHTVPTIIDAIDELRTSGAIALSDSDAVGLVGWAPASSEALRLRKHRAAKAKAAAKPASRRGRAAA